MVAIIGIRTVEQRSREFRDDLRELGLAYQVRRLDVQSLGQAAQVTRDRIAPSVFIHPD